MEVEDGAWLSTVAATLDGSGEDVDEEVEAAPARIEVLIDCGLAEPEIEVEADPMRMGSVCVQKVENPVRSLRPSRDQCRRPVPPTGCENRRPTGRL